MIYLKELKSLLDQSMAQLKKKEEANKDLKQIITRITKETQLKIKGLEKQSE